MKGAVAFAAALFFAGAGAAAEVASATGAVIRALDKASGQTEDIEVASGATAEFGRLSIALSDCRYPVDDPSSNAFAHLTISIDGGTGPEFQGWMVAASPALSALDDPRYDVWLLRCMSS